MIDHLLREREGVQSSPHILNLVRTRQKDALIEVNRRSACKWTLSEVGHNETYLDRENQGLPFAKLHLFQNSTLSKTSLIENDT